jgi:hypothetical protein
MRKAKVRNVYSALTLVAFIAITIAVPASLYAVDESTIWTSSGGLGDPLFIWGNLLREARASCGVLVAAHMLRATESTAAIRWQV